MLKILQLGFNSMWTENFQMFKLDLEKAEEPEVKLPTLEAKINAVSSQNSREIKIFLKLKFVLNVYDSKIFR